MAGIGLHRILADAVGLRGREVIPRIITVAQPPANTEWSQLVPGGTVWFPQVIQATLQTDVNAGSRFPHLLASDGTTSYMKVASANTQAASLTVVYNWLGKFSAFSLQGTTATMNQPFPGIPIIGGQTLSTSTSNRQVGDQWSAISLFVLEIEETPYDIEVARDLSRLAGSRVDAVPQYGLET